MRRPATLAGRGCIPYVGPMTDATRTTPRGPAQIHAPLQAWFAAKEREPVPEHLIALVDELELIGESAARKAS